MNILDKIASVLSPDSAPFLGYLPAQPDACAALFEYEAEPPGHSFGGGIDLVHGVQARCRALDSAAAYRSAKDIAERLHGYHDGEISVIQSTPILDIGRDGNNPQRQEYTVNFTARRS